MDFFKSVFSDDPSPSDSPTAQTQPQNDDVPVPNPDSTGAWSFGGLIKTLASKSETVIQTYHRDIEEFRSGLKKETAVFREAASRAVKDLPTSLEVGASVAQESLESVGQAIDDIGSTVWKSTAKIISHGRDTILPADIDSTSSDNDNSKQLNYGNQSLDSKRYRRFDAQLRAIQCDVNTYCGEPEDLEEYNNWKLGFVLDERGVEIENLIGENKVIGDIYGKVVPSRVDCEGFWSRYFYRVHKLRQVEDARARLVKRVISGEEEEDLSWDFGDEDEDSGWFESKGNSSRNVDLGKKISEEVVMEHNEVENLKKIEIEETGVVGGESMNDSEDKSEVRVDEKVVLDGKAENADSCKDSDVSIVSSQPSLPEEEDLGWDEIEDIGSSDDSKKDAASSTNRADLRKRLSAAEEEEDLSWDIEDDDDVPVKS